MSNEGVVCVYLGRKNLDEIRRQAARLDRPISWIVQRCVKLALHEVQALPAPTDLSEDEAAQ